MENISRILPMVLQRILLSIVSLVLYTLVSFGILIVALTIHRHLGIEIVSTNLLSATAGSSVTFWCLCFLKRIWFPNPFYS